MAASGEDSEIGDLSEIYDTLRVDAKTIVKDLRGGVTMWREAAAANLAAAGFLFILALTTYHNGPSGLEGTLLETAQVALGLVLSLYSVYGFRRYFRLREKYQKLFERAEKLE